MGNEKLLNPEGAEVEVPKHTVERLLRKGFTRVEQTAIAVTATTKEKTKSIKEGEQNNG